MATTMAATAMIKLITAKAKATATSAVASKLSIFSPPDRWIGALADPGSPIAPWTGLEDTLITCFGNERAHELLPFLVSTAGANTAHPVGPGAHKWKRGHARRGPRPPESLEEEELAFVVKAGAPKGCSLLL